MANDESELIRRLQAAETSAFRELVENHKQRLFNLAYDLLGNAQDAEDVSQEAFIKVFRGIGDFRGEAQLGSWMHRIVVNLCLNRRRKKALSEMELRESFEGDEMHQPIPAYDPTANPEIMTEAEIMRAHLRCALDMLSPQQRTVFILRHDEDLPLAEIGKMLKITSCKKYEPWLAAKVFGDLGAADEQKLRLHLSDCAKCRAALAEMQHVLGAVGAPTRPEMPEHFWGGYWHRLVARMEKDERAAPEPAFALSRFWNWLRAAWHEHPLFIPVARTAGILALLFAGVLVGHYWWPRQESAQITPSPPEVQLAQARAEQWLERSKILLIGVVNEDFSDPAQSDFSQQRQISRSLVTQARALRREINPAANRQLLQLMSQLELILLQIANLEAEHDLSAVDLVRDGIARDGLLLKINIAEMAQQEQRSSAPAKADRKSL